MYENKDNDSPIAPELIQWYRIHKRDLPWRHTADPYRIWISEIILQQTRVAQGLDYYIRFISRFPDIVSLAEADNDEVMKYWQGLGYYSRARNLHAAARFMAEKYAGRFPKTYKEVLGLNCSRYLFFLLRTSLCYGRRECLSRTVPAFCHRYTYRLHPGKKTVLRPGKRITRPEKSG